MKPYFIYRLDENLFLPNGGTAFKVPLSFRVRLRSHCAIGDIYDIRLESNTIVHCVGISIRKRIMLNFPNPNADTAVSKSAGPSTTVTRVSNRIFVTVSTFSFTLF